MSIAAVTTAAAPVPRGPYVHGRSQNGHVWVTGQIGRDPVSGDFVPGGFVPEFHQAITNLESILAEFGCALTDVVRAEVQFVEEADLDAMNRIYGERFAEPFPARTSYGVAFLWKGAQVQISCVAAQTDAAPSTTESEAGA